MTCYNQILLYNYFAGIRGPMGRGRGPVLPHPRFDPMGPLPGQFHPPGRGGGIWEAGGNRHGHGRGGGLGPRFFWHRHQLPWWRHGERETSTQTAVEENCKLRRASSPEFRTWMGNACPNWTVGLLSADFDKIKQNAKGSSLFLSDELVWWFGN